LSALAAVAYYLLLLFFLLLLFRMVMEYIFMFSRSYRPAGPMLVVVEAAYTVTDPPLKLLRRVIPPLRVANFAIDIGFLVLSVVVLVLMSVVRGLS
jgi:YggT family protein